MKALREITSRVTAPATDFQHAAVGFYVKRSKQAVAASEAAGVDNVFTEMREKIVNIEV